MGRIFIPGNCPSLKNSKIKTANGIFPSKTVKKYLQSLGIKSYSASRKIIETYRQKYPYKFGPIVEPMRQYLAGMAPPYVIGLHFVRGSRHRFDGDNAGALIRDLLVAARVIPDDDMDNLITIPILLGGKWYTYNKNNPGVWIYPLSKANIEGLYFD